MGKKFYTVSRKFADLGHQRYKGNDHDIIHVVMLQADPGVDYKLTQQGKWQVKDTSVAAAPRAFFIHANIVKFNPGGKKLLEESLNEFDDGRRRMWTTPQTSVQRLGYDIERMAWEEVMIVSCTLAGAFETWEAGDGLCEDVQRHWDTVFENPDADGLNFTQH